VHILVVCPHFEPDAAPTGEVMTRIVHELVDLGHRVHVVTSLPWYVEHRIEPGWEGSWVRHEATPWGRITRVHPFPTDKTNIPARALAFGGFTALAALRALLSRQRPDVVLAMSPPLTLGLAGWVAARRHRVPFVFNIQDVFPDVAIEVGAITSRHVIRASKWLERFTYRRADAVTVLSDDLARNVMQKLGPDGDRVHVIPNFVDTEWIRPLDRDNPYRREFDLGERTVVMYAGNVGFSQSLDLVLAAAEELRARPDVVFVVNGGGSAREPLMAEAARRGLDNVVFVGLQPKTRLPELLAAADIHLVPLKAGLAASSVPSKTYSILASGRCLLASVDEGTEVARVVTEAGAGLAVPPDDRDAFIGGLTSLLDDPARVSACGRSARAYVEQWASPAAVAGRYEALFVEVGVSTG